MSMIVEPSGQACGATIRGVDLSGKLDDALITDVRSAWLTHRVLAFADQSMDDDALERFTLAMGGFGEDPFFDPIPGRGNIAAILREPDEKAPLFAENWHSDWSFLSHPPAGTCLLAIEIPPVGGDTLFADQIAAFAALSDERKDQLRALTAIHSAKLAYAPDGTYGEKDAAAGRSMAIRPDESANAMQTHPLIQAHPETGEEAIFSTLGYIIGIEGMAQAEAIALLSELAQWQSRDEFVYRHHWEPDMLVLWDNRSVLHKATGGYEGHRRELHRTTIAATP
ncbi:TauD/TfdA dioxygenase family protein [Erythrobacter litoralis]|uniref:Alpha-ketoglutarate-dependent taurine dioxygenase n=1 Tax=Erythrobacter litoralis (strain HTCC2594) TaxID=314225 RepID=Q2NAD0_ERYLH|nr:TauD/TfdA family dioxygenase [Erythrobacter litoralis]ABC63361.1 alpha-ketoglutarate-dependent taurine dioxygenase [Erythrobacter litoralis HTCC2594]